jgi:secreted trypsin-like serine protease
MIEYGVFWHDMPRRMPRSSALGTLLPHPASESRCAPLDVPRTNDDLKHATGLSLQPSWRTLIMFNLSRKYLFAIIGLTLAAASLHASAQQRIVGGSFVPSGSYKWTAALLNSNGSWFCGGSLIAQKWVVTAAHCSGNAASVRLGSVDRASGGQVIRVKRRIIHPGYGPNANDIALLELESAALGITPIARGTTTPADGSSIRLLGWGQVTAPFGNDSGSRYLKMLDTTVQTRANCPNAGPGDLCITGKVTATPCKGDSGGPAISNGKLVGATSRAGRATDTCGVGTVYSNVTQYKNWIDSYVN